MQKSKILILGFTNKSGVSVAKALSKHGCLVDAVLLSDAASKYTRYVRKIYYQPKSLTDIKSFVKNLVQYLISEKYDALIPTYDGGLEICREYYSEISEHVKIVGLNSNESYKYSINKSELLNLGSKVGLHIPNTYLLQSFNDIQPEKFNNYKYPIVAKPVSSAKIVNNQLITYSVKICNNSTELHDFIREHINNVPILIQEFVSGYGLGYNFISSKGEVYNSYIHKRLNEISGVSTYRESFPSYNFEMEKEVKLLIKQMNWDGVGMIEFKVDNNEKAVLMEFNGRFFGSTELSVYAGVSLPVLFYEKFVIENDIRKNLPVKNVKVRFLHDEVLPTLQSVFRLQLSKTVGWLVELMYSLIQKNNFIEDNIFKDFRFVLGMYYYDLRRYYTKVNERKLTNSIKINPVKPTDLTTPKNIFFICAGNICRSPFAHAYARNLNTIHNFDSAGVVLEENRKSPINAYEAALHFNISLEEHTSKSIYSIDRNKVDLYIVMDKKNHFQLIKAGIESHKIFFLANYEITDPYNTDINNFIKTYTLIQENINNTFKI